ncbi:MAG TPA: AAA family ATPase [Anaerolineae bacterium]|nr:AAA family ATPase [Anaerolineae bacterium]
MKINELSEAAQLEQSIAALETQRAHLGDAVVDPLITAAREKLTALAASVPRPKTGPLPESRTTARQPARARPPALQGKHKQVTVIIADVKGSTALLEQLGTEEWVKLMNRVFQILETEIYRYGGEVDQFRGDGLLAFFGATVVHEDDPERAVLAGLAMQSAIQRFAAALRRQRGLDLQLRIGVNTGAVIVAKVGDRRQHSEDTAMGEAIALAARLEAAAEPGAVLVGESTYRLTQAQFTWKPLGSLQVKGLQSPVNVYRPLSAQAAGSKLRGIAGLRAPMIGRETEAAQLRDALARLQQGAGRIVTIIGDAGLGKSRLIAEVYDDAVRPQPAATRPRWVEGRCRSYGASIAYLLWLDVLRGLLGVTPEDSPQHILGRLRAHVGQLATADIRYPERLERLTLYLGHLLSLPLEDVTPLTMEELEGERFKRGAFRAIEAFIEGITHRQPLVIVCEDLHWADPTSLELLERLFHLTERAPLLILCLLRPETAHGGTLVSKTAAQRHVHPHTDLWLTPLSPVESARLVDALLPGDDIPATLKKRILNHAEGNPFYVEEIIRSLLDSGAITRDPANQRWRITREAVHITIPPTLYGVLMARIDRLPEEARRVLQMAAVIGRIFRQRILASIARRSVPLERVLRLLQAEDLIHAQPGAPEAEYIFKHHLIMEAAYNSLLKHEQQHFHQQVAQSLEQAAPEPQDEQIGLLAHHWAGAQQPEKAVTYLLRAAAQAAAHFANAEAADYYSRALALLPGADRQRYAALLAREKLYDLLGARGPQSADLAELASLANQLDDPALQAEVALRQAQYAEATGDYGAVIVFGKKALNLARVARDAHSEAAGYLMWGRALYYLDDHRAAREQLHHALDLAADIPQVEADTLRSLGMAAFDLDEAREYQQRALHIHRKIGDRRGERAALYNLGEIAFDQGQYARAVALYEQALSISREIGDRYGETLALDALGFIHREQGNYAEARACYAQVLRIARKTGDRAAEGRALLTLSTATRDAGAPVEAAESARQALGIARELGLPTLWTSALLALAYACRAAGLAAEAAAAYHQALDLNAAADDPDVTLTALAGLAEVFLAQGDWRRAKDQVDHILHCLETLDRDLLNDPCCLYLTCAHVLDPQHDPRTRRLIEEAHALLQEGAAHLRDRDARRAYLENVPAHREIVQFYHQLGVRS